MHIGKNIIETLWKILDGRGDKEKIVKICSDIQKSNHAMKNVIQSNSHGDQINISDLPWLLTDQQSNAIKEVIRKNSISHRICCEYKQSHIKEN